MWTASVTCSAVLCHRDGIATDPVGDQSVGVHVELGLVVGLLESSLALLHAEDQVFSNSA